MYEITVERIFSAAHAIRLPDGALEALHGHDWRVEVTVAATDLDGIETVMDFHELEGMVNRAIGRVHNGNLNEIPPFSDGQGGLAVNPTAERVAWWLAGEVAPGLPDHVHLVRVRIGEAPGCYATYFPSGDR